MHPPPVHIRHGSADPTQSKYVNAVGISPHAAEQGAGRVEDCDLAAAPAAQVASFPIYLAKQVWLMSPTSALGAAGLERKTKLVWRLHEGVSKPLETSRTASDSLF